LCEQGQSLAIRQNQAENRMSHKTISRRHIMAIDQGTTSTRTIIFGPDMAVVACAQLEFSQHYPASGWVEHDPEDIWRTVLATARSALKKAKLKAVNIAGVGITNQRETTIVWDRATGLPIHNAIVWQDRRAVDSCQLLKAAGHEKLIARKTGLLLDPYFSGTKIAWILDHVKGARAKAEKGKLAFGTVDSFLISRLTKGRVHATDATNASRTLLLDINTGEWDAELLSILNVPASILPEVKDCAADFGMVDAEWFGAEIPILGVAGDQQAATIGQACFEPGMMKSTYGTGCFALLNIGSKPVQSKKRLLTTIAYQFDGKRTYALEGSIFIAGAAVQWLRDGLKVIASASEAGKLAKLADPNQKIVLVPAFVGLGAPYWDAECRGAVFGLTRNTGPAEMAKATLESVCFQTRDLMEAMRADWKGATGSDTVLRVDGGMTASDWTMQRLADMLDAPVDRPKVLETTALGAAYLAGWKAGIYGPPATFAKRWKRQKRFLPKMDAAERASSYAIWKDAVRRTLS
jgi:glycerol kinase